jgi:hypothetical protein
LPKTLSELLCEVRRMREGGKGQKAILEYVKRVAGYYGIRVRQDLHMPHSAPKYRLRRPIVEAPAEEGGTSIIVVNPSGEKAGFVDFVVPEGCQLVPLVRGPEAVAGAQDEAGADRKEDGPEKRIALPVVRNKNGTYSVWLGAPRQPPDPRAAKAPTKTKEASPQAPTPRATPGESELVTVGRVVLSNDKKAPRAGRTAPICYECNGLVLDARTWRPLAVPPCAFAALPAAKVLDERLAAGDYDIVRVDDGTVVTVYSWEHPADGTVWAIGSSNGFDVSNLYWCGPLTYAEVFVDLARRRYPDFVAETGLGLEKDSDGGTRLRFDKLDCDYCYTIGFRHHNYHPVRADPERMWVVQCTYLGGPAPAVEFGGGRLPGLPPQTVCTADEIPGAGWPPTAGSLREIGKEAFERAAVFIATEAGERRDSRALPSELNYGYMLRARAGTSLPDLLVETPLLSNVRRVIYERPPRNIRDNITSGDRIAYSAVRAFLTIPMRATFLALCPEWKETYANFSEFANKVIEHAVHVARQKSLPGSRVPRPTTVTSLLAERLLDLVKGDNKNLEAFQPNLRDVVHDQLISPGNALVFHMAFQKHATRAKALRPEDPAEKREEGGPQEEEAAAGT